MSIETQAEILRFETEQSIAAVKCAVNGMLRDAYKHMELAGHSEESLRRAESALKSLAEFIDEARRNIDASVATLNQTFTRIGAAT